MIRQRMGALVLRVYPPSALADRGDEILGTLLDAGADSPAAFARESASLVLAGVRARATASAQVPPVRLVADAFRQAALVWIAVWLAGVSALAFASPPRGGSLEMWLLFLWPVLALSLLRYDRWAGVGGLAWVASVQLPIALGPYPLLLAGSLVPLVGFMVMTIIPRRQPHDLRRLAWLLPTIAASAIMQPAVLGFGALGVGALAILSLAGALVLVADPRPLMTAALVWASIGMMYAEPLALHGGPISSPVLLVASAPFTLVIVCLRLRKLRHRSE